jgi:hypothetical protein
MFDKIKQLLSYRNKSLPINAQRAYELIDIFTSAMGSSFFINANMRKSHYSEKLEYCHPLLKDLSECEKDKLKMDLVLVEILELGLYIEAFAQDKNIVVCLNNLKAPKQYHSTFYQLAMGYRLIKMGCKVSLEPITDRGKSDLFYEFKSSKYIAECYKIQKTFIDYIGEFESTLRDAIFSAANKNKAFNFYLKLIKPITFYAMRQLRNRFLELLAEFENNPEIKAKEIEFSGNQIGIDISQRLEFLNCTSCWSQTSIKANNAFESIGAPENKCRRQHHLYVWHNYKRQGLKDPYDILQSNLSEKLKQTKTTGNSPKRVLFAHFPFGIDKNKKNSDKQIELIRSASRNFDNIFAIILTTRQLQNTNRFMYNGVFISPKPDNEVNEFITAFQQIEESNFF